MSEGSRASRPALRAAGHAAEPRIDGVQTSAGVFSLNRSGHLGGPIFLKSEDPAELAREHRRLGYSAAYCPLAKAEDTVRVRAIEKAFAAENVVIAEVGAWVNMLDPDTEKRRANLHYVVERMALAEAAGARCCVDID
jgi:sugar phosphate isomerase/epimerase